jgi:hypothetical protein
VADAVAGAVADAVARAVADALVDAVAGTGGAVVAVVADAGDVGP